MQKNGKDQMNNTPNRWAAVVPALNEARRIGEVIRRCAAQAPEVWLIDDGSRDQTGELAREAGARVIRHDVNLGKGAAIRTALMEFAKSDLTYLVFLDADGQHDPSLLTAFTSAARTEGADLVVGNRMGQSRNMPLIRRWTNLLMSRVVSYLSGLPIPDSQCGFRLVSRRFAQTFQPTTWRFDLESEMLIQAGRMGLKIVSVTIPAIYEGGGSHIQPITDTLRFIRLVWRYRTRGPMGRIKEK